MKNSIPILVSTMCAALGLMLVAADAQTGSNAASVLNDFQARVGQGTYSRWVCYTQMMTDSNGIGTPNNCTYAESQAKNWHNWGTGPVERFNFPGDGTIELVFIAQQQTVGNITAIGTPAGPSISDIKWECPKIQYQGNNPTIIGKEPAWVQISADMTDVQVVCGVTNPAAYPSAKYVYWWYQRN